MKKILLLLVLLIIPTVSADQGHLVLLTVAEQGSTRIGGTADLFLEVKKGSGRIFIDSFPLTKLDTQISTRFAKEVACQQIDADCSDKDFFYTIKADSTIIGGPSAGVGLAVLTAAVLLDAEMDETVAFTGTINSGGIVGPVAGIPEKVEAAKARGMSKVVIPRWVSLDEEINDSNTSIEVVRVGNLYEAVNAFTNLDLGNSYGEIEISDTYKERMLAVSDIICDRTDALLKEINDKNLDYEDKSNFTEKLANAKNLERHYTAASYCFSENVVLRQIIVKEDSTFNHIMQIRAIAKAIAKMDKEIDEIQLQTLSDLETYMVVKERLVDAAQILKKLDLDEIDTGQLAYVMERYFSAFAWSQFFGLGGQTYNLDNEQLSDACMKKISEAEERVDYVGTISSSEILKGTRDELNLAYKDRNNGDFALCIFKATKAKAEADMFLLGITVPLANIENVINEKLEATKRVILHEQEKGIFPVLGYSYYEYADSLKVNSPSSSLMFSEYALEMSNLELYFPPNEVKGINWPDIELELLGLFLFGVILGFIVGKGTKKNKKKARTKAKK